MKFRCERDTLAEAVAAAQRAVASRTGAMPVLSGLKMTLVGDTLELIGTDLELTIRVRVPADGELICDVRADRLDALRGWAEEAGITLRGGLAEPRGGLGFVGLGLAGGEQLLHELDAALATGGGDASRKFAEWLAINIRLPHRASPDSGSSVGNVRNPTETAARKRARGGRLPREERRDQLLATASD